VVGSDYERDVFERKLRQDPDITGPVDLPLLDT
jgi:hypothetical protein